MKTCRMQMGDIATIIDGDRGSNYPKQNEFFDKGFCLFLNAGNVTSEGFVFENNSYISAEKDKALRKGKLKRGDIVYTTRGTIGNVAYYKSTVPFENIRINSGMVILRVNEELIDAEYLYQYLKSTSTREYFLSFKTGSAQPQLPIKNFSRIQINVPDISSQKHIASILSAYDDLIENNRRQIKLLEEAAQRLYREWFVELRFPGYENVKIVDGVPEGWKVVFLGDVIEFDPKVPLTKDHMKQSVPMAALSASSMVLDQSLIEKTMSNSGSKFKNGDSLLARITPCLENGKTAFVDCLDSDEGAVGSTEFIVMRSKNLNPCMVYCIARSDGFRTEAINSMTGSDGRQRAQKDKLKALSYILPPKSLIDRFEQFAQPCFDKIKVLNRQNGFLVKARDKLLPKLMSGEMEVFYDG